MIYSTIRLENVYRGLDDHQESIFVSLDISKAFDRVWHEGLIHKLKQNGICGPLLAWFTSYLTNRRQRVVISGQTSTYQNLYAGVPQGSILGPFLFLVYVSDMTKDLKTQIHQFADDINILETFTDPVVAVSNINHDLNLLYHW